jgi:secondary thiamine-phosphate synthase enzyme
MPVRTQTIALDTQGNADVLDITHQAAQVVKESGLSSGTVTLFTPSATSALTTIEYEPGCVSDFRRLFDEVADPGRQYSHNIRQGDGNGHSHVRAALLGPSLTIPFMDGQMALGTWQHIIFVDFDTRPRHRELIAQCIGE